MTLTVIILTLTGIVFFYATTVGILRFPDFYSRLHAAGKGDTLSSLLILLALMLYNFHELNLANLLVAMKILLIVVFIFMASPTATHAIVDAGYESGVQPWTKKSEPED
ncbi:MAG: monovalent cation/H(+) antiporter subunit G [Deltaproteobacteria bacterium]|jgi:multicomponent Na+:H+ antiporter subunit G|nr:monovalent cation/H(+) antiporter subunit G [Deltaproteobacteria bacterium]